MRLINYIVVHCTATPLTATVESIENYWRNFLQWKRKGYHVLIETSGKIREIQDIDIPANGVRGYNGNSIHIATIGGQHVDDRTPQQKDALWFLLKGLLQKFPDAELLGHRDFPNVAKACPRYNVKEWFENYIPFGG
jgi:N-acetylmuramoyl-L-alanine amidase